RSRSRDRTRDVGHLHPYMIASMIYQGGQIRGLTRLPARRLPWARAGPRVFRAVTNRDHEARASHQHGTTRPLLPRWPWPGQTPIHQTLTKSRQRRTARPASVGSGGHTPPARSRCGLSRRPPRSVTSLLLASALAGSIGWWLPASRFARVSVPA